MSYPGNIEDCKKFPSKGGMAIGDLKILASKMGIDIKSLLKVQICDKIQEKLGKNFISSQSKVKLTYKVSPSVSKPPVKDSPIAKKPTKALWSSQEYCDWFDQNSSDAQSNIDIGCTPNWTLRIWKDKPFNKAESKWFASQLDSSVTLKTTDTEICDILGKWTPDKKWFDRQSDYVILLDGSDRALLKDYTFHGDEIINRFLRGNVRLIVDRLSTETKRENIPFYNYLGPKPTEMRVMNGLDSVIKDLKNIINNAPKLDRDIYVFRGVDDISYFSSGKWMPIHGFFSTSISPRAALNFAEPYLLRIFVPKGTPTLWMSPISKFSTEVELLFPSDSQLLLEECGPEMAVHMIGTLPGVIAPERAACTGTFGEIIQRVKVCDARLKLETI